MKKKLQEFKEIHSNKQTLVDPKINQYKMQLVKVNNKIDKLLSKIIGSSKTLMNYVNNKIEEFDREKQRLQEEILILSANSKEKNICKIINYMDNWDKIEIQDKLFTIDSLIELL